MRPFLIAATLVIAAGVLASAPAAAQTPDTSPPPPGPPPQVAVPRESAPEPSAPAPAPAPAPGPVAEERRGSVRAPERAVERPVRIDTPSEESRTPRNVVITEDVGTARADSSAEAEQQRGQRRGSVRRPPSDGGSRSGDRAVARGSAPPPTRTTIIRNYPYRYYPNYYRYYDPWGYGSFGLGYFYYSPWAWGPYGSHGYPGYYAGYGGYGYDVGSVRLKVSPRDAEVWVDGYYAGLVDDFDGMFQALKLDTGPYRIEIRKPGFETLFFDVRVLPERTITFRGTLRPTP